MKAVGYLRVSTLKQVEEGFSLDGQEAEIIDYCIRNGIELIKMFNDKGKSGSNTEDRDGINEMIEYAIDSKVDAVVTYKLSRFSRSSLDLEIAIDKLSKNDIKIIFVSEGFDTESATGKLVTSMIGAVSQMERNNILEFTHMGSYENAKAGNWNGGRSIGYRSSDKNLIIVEDEANIVRYIFELYIEEGYGINKIARHLNSIGVKTLRGRNFAPQTIASILDNPVYKGYINWTKYKGKKNEEVVYIKGNHTPIISEEAWNKAYSRRKKGVKRARVYEGDFLLSGIAKCPVCEGSMSSAVKENGRYRYYRCSNNAQLGVCKSNLVNSDNLDRQVMEKVGELLLNKKIIKEVVKNINKGSNISSSNVNKKIKEIEKDLSNIEKNRNEVYQEKLSGSMDLKEMNRFLNHINKMKKEKEEQLEILMKELNKNNIIVSEDRVFRILKDKLLGISENENDIKKKKEIIMSLIDKVVISEGYLPKDRKLEEVVLYFEPDEVLDMEKYCANESKGMFRY